jgi:hypothetical protein
VIRFRFRVLDILTVMVVHGCFGGSQFFLACHLPGDDWRCEAFGPHRRPANTATRFNGDPTLSRQSADRLQNQTVTLWASLLRYSL